MKQFSCLILFGFLLVFSLKAQNIQIPDQCFINALIDLGVDSNEDGLISYAEAEAVEILDFWIVRETSSQNWMPREIRIWSSFFVNPISSPIWI